MKNYLEGKDGAMKDIVRLVKEAYNSDNKKTNSK